MEQVRKEQQESDVDPLQEVLEEAVGMLRNDLPLAEHDDQAKCAEAECRPGRSEVALTAPLIDRRQRKRHVSPQAYVPQNLNR